MMKKASAAVSLLLALSILFSACSGLGKIAGGINRPGKEGKTGQAKSIVLSPENTSAAANGVTVDVGEYVLGGETELTVAKKQSEDHSEDGYKIDVYDIKLGDMHELDDFITIRIPYDTTYCDKGQDPAKCVGAKYKNEETGEWEDVLFEVDAEACELVIYTDHLSEYGAFCVEDEGRRRALITDINDSRLKMSQEQTIDFASRIADGDSDVRKDLNEFVSNASDVFFDWSDRLDNAINIATLGDVPPWLSTDIPETNQTLFSALGYVATARSLMTIALKESVGGGASKGEILNLIRDVGSKVTTYWANAFTTVGSGALSVGMGGVLIIDKMLTAFAEEAKSTKLEDIGYVYHHYNEGFSAPWAHKLMKPKDWRKKVIEAIEKNPDDPEAAIDVLEKGFRKYASDFFSLTADQQAEVASDVPNVTVKRIPDFTEAEKEQMIDEYVAFLKDKYMPAILKSVQVYFVRKSEQAELYAMNKIKNFYNTRISVTISEDLKSGEKSRYAGYQFRFAPLGKDAVKESWKGTWNEKGKITSTATLIGFMTAGYPHTVEFFKPGADMDADEPEFTIPFVISMPSITITLPEPGHWVLTDSGSESRENTTDADGQYIHTFEADIFEHRASYRYDPDVVGRVDEKDVPWFVSFVCGISGLPENISPGETFSVDIRAEAVTYDTMLHFICCGIYITDGYLTQEFLPLKFVSANGYDYESQNKPIYAGNSPGPAYGYPFDAPWLDGMSDTVTITMPGGEKAEKLSVFRICFESSAGKSWVEYKWVTD